MHKDIRYYRGGLEWTVWCRVAAERGRNAAGKVRGAVTMRIAIKESKGNKGRKSRGRGQSVRGREIKEFVR